MNNQNVPAGNGNAATGGTDAAGNLPLLAAGAACNPTIWGNFSECSGSPAIKSRINQCGGFQTVYCAGTIQSRAVVLSPSDTTCAAAQASVTGLPGTVHQFTAGSATQPAPQTQSADSYVTFANTAGGTYTINPTASANYALAAACWRKGINTPSPGTGLTSWLSVPFDADTLTWDLGYVPVGPWTQTAGGNVAAGGEIKNLVPAGTSPRLFALTGDGGYPGLVTYGTSYDFDPDYNSLGESYVSSTNWLATKSPSTIDWYTYYHNKLGGPQTADTFSDLTSVAKPASRTKPYYVVGDMTTSGNWSVGDGETIMFLVNGNLTIGGSVTMTGTGFVAFIVKGNITVSPNVGGLYTSSTPVIEGLYMTSPTGIFKTGPSSVAGKERLVLKGTFVASNFTLERNLENVNANAVASAELFIYNPVLPILMPDSLKDVPITWQEVAP